MQNKVQFHNTAVVSFRPRPGRPRRRPKKFLLRLCALAILLGGGAILWKSAPWLGRVLPKAAMTSAGIQLLDNSISGSVSPQNTPGEILPLDPQSSSPEENTAQTPSQGESEGVPSEETSSLLTKEEAAAQGLLPVKETQLATTGNARSADGLVTMNNKSKVHTINVEEQLAKTPDVHITDTKEPQVLIYHTHTTESYMAGYNGYYPKDMATRSLDGDKGVVRVGAILAEKLNAAGINTIHDTTINDSPAYNGAYGRSLSKAEAYLAQHPSIQIILDVHRDSLTQEDGTKLKPTVTVNGKKAAQIMIVSGCDDTGTLGYPEWRENLVFGLQLQKRLATVAPNLARPLYFWSIRYNQHLTHGTLLVEFGTEVNTYDEVAYSAELFAQALVQTLQDYKA